MSFPYSATVPRRSVRIAEKRWADDFHAAAKRVRAGLDGFKAAKGPNTKIFAAVCFLEDLMDKNKIVLAHPLTRSAYREMFQVMPTLESLRNSIQVQRLCIYLQEIMDNEIEQQEALQAQWNSWKAAGLV